MDVVLVTGSGGLVGSESVRFHAKRADLVVGIDNDMRATFFGAEASTAWNVAALERDYPNYRHVRADIRDAAAIGEVFATYGRDVSTVIHCAAQPSHDWAAREPMTDFSVNATGTLVLLEAARAHCPDAVFVFTSTNKVYGDRPNDLPLVEGETRWSVEPGHPFAEYGIDETMSIDASTHSLFGASKVAADVLVQEYGRYFGMRTGVFRGGCLTGPSHSGTQLHGFLAYLMKCTVTGTPYTIFGHSGKQVRDNIHAVDLVAAFDAFARDPRPGEVYNMGGGPSANVSMLEAIELCQTVAGRSLSWTYDDRTRIGDHIWYVSDLRKFSSHYPDWSITYDVEATLRSIHDEAVERWESERAS